MDDKKKNKRKKKFAFMDCGSSIEEAHFFVAFTTKDEKCLQHIDQSINRKFSDTSF